MNKMTVPQLRAAIILNSESTRTANGKPVYCLPNGKIISKATKPALVAYLGQLLNEAQTIQRPERTLTQLEQVVARCNNRIKKYSKRRSRPNNVKLLGKWTDRRQKAVTEIGQLMTDAA